MPATPDSILRSQIVDLVRQSDQTHLAIGRLLAETFYNNDRSTYESRAPKDISLRLLALELRTNYDMPRSFSSVRQMLAAYFQEPDLRLSESEAHALSWRARVELLRVHTPEEKAEWAHKAIAEKLSVRKLARRLSEAHPPLRKPRTARQRLLRLARRMENILSLWPGAPPDAAQTLRQLHDNISNAPNTTAPTVCTRPPVAASQPPADCVPPTAEKCSLPAVVPHAPLGDLRNTTYDIRLASSSDDPSEVVTKHIYGINNKGEKVLLRHPIYLKGCRPVGTSFKLPNGDDPW